MAFRLCCSGPPRGGRSRRRRFHGRHIRPDGYLRDMEKYNEAAATGWLLIRVLPAELLSLRTLQLIVRACNQQNH